MLLGKASAGNMRRFAITSQRPLAASRRLRCKRPLLFLGALLSLGTQTVGSLANGPAYPTGPAPIAVAVGDFNGDGFLDVAVADYGNASDGYQGSVSIFLGRGDGTLVAAQSYAVGFYSNAVAVGDFNGDGRLDIVVVNGGQGASGTISILLGNGDGTFAAARNYGVGSTPMGVAVGDFNRDGSLDLAVANFYDQTVRVLLGNGDGTFQSAQTFPVGPNPTFLAASDFNGDTIPDLAVAGSSGVSILLGNGDGTFQAAQNFAAGLNPNSIAVGDFNGDGSADLAVANYGDGTGQSAGVSILLGNGDGSFQAAQYYATGFTPVSVVTGYFNNDGHLDIVMGVGSALSILVGKGDGTFQAPAFYATGSISKFLAMGDFNGDGIPDLAVTDDGDNTVTIVLGKGDGTF